MGRVILTKRDGQTDSFKCKSKERAEEISNKRPNVVHYAYYEDSERIPESKKKRRQEQMPQSFDELDMLIKANNILSY